MSTRWLVLFAICFCLLCLSSRSEEKGKATRRQALSPLGTPTATISNINNISAWYSANGEQEREPISGNAGLTFPRGTATAIYAAGLIWGGQFHDGRSQTIRVNGQSYNNGTKPGAILGIRTGNSEDPNSDDVRIWRIRKDYSTANLVQDAAEINEVPVGSVTEGMIAAVRDEYRRSWAEWPWQKGAPFYDTGYLGTGGVIIGANNGVLDWGEDANHNGVLDPGEDVNGNGRLDAESPGIVNADQVIWYVCNDIGVAQPWTCLTTGMEEQMTIWAYAGSSIIFKRFRLIYKGIALTPANATIDSMYLTQWTDAELGDCCDDFAGCDSALSLGFVYNGRPSDRLYSQFGLVPPAIGNDLLQGPIIRTGNSADTAIFDLKKVSGAKNLPLTSFLYHATGGGIFTDPSFSYSGALQWYRVLGGCPPTLNQCPYVDPVTQQPTKFWASGDPVAGTGWIDGIFDGPGDRRFVMSSGPFTMAVGDTQEIVVAVVGGLGQSAIQSVSALKDNDRNAQALYNTLFTTRPPVTSARLQYPNGTQVSLQVNADCRGTKARTIHTVLYRTNGTTAGQMQLFDDGLHGDSTANDGIFGNGLAMQRELTSLHGDFTVVDSLDRTFLWQRLLGPVTIAGPISLRSFHIFSDNLNGDGQANPGENIRYGFTTISGCSFLIQSLSIRPSLEPRHVARTMPLVNPGVVDSMVYGVNNPSSYFTVDIPLMYADSLFFIPVTFSDTLGNSWADTIRLRVHPLPGIVHNADINHPVSFVQGNFHVMVVDPTAVRNHLYVIRGINTFDSVATLGFSIKDSTDGRVVLVHNGLPDSLGHTVPLTDGFKVVRGTIETSWGARGYTRVPPPWGWWQNGATGLLLDNFSGAIGTGCYTWYTHSSSPPYRLRSVLVKFASTDSAGNLVNPSDTLASFGYRYLRNADRPPARPEFAPYIINPGAGFAYQAYQRSVPFAAYDTNSIPPRRLMVGHLENNVLNGSVDGKYWPPYASANNADTTGPREWFFIFDVPYSETPDPRLQRTIDRDTLPIIWWGAPTRINPFRGGDVFRLYASFPYTSFDTWTFYPGSLSAPDGELPFGFELSQNYPNPFNPQTTIQYALAGQARITLRVYNILGQEITTLVDDVEEANEHQIVWEGRNSIGNKVASGVYFYRLEAKGMGGNISSFVQVKKMLLIK